MQESQVWSLDQEDPLEKGMATLSSILAWRTHEQRSLAGYSSWGYKELDTTEQLTPSLYWTLNIHLAQRHMLGVTEHFQCVFNIFIYASDRHQGYKIYNLIVLHKAAFNKVILLFFNNASSYIKFTQYDAIISSWEILNGLQRLVTFWYLLSNH